MAQLHVHREYYYVKIQILTNCGVFHTCANIPYQADFSASTLWPGNEANNATGMETRVTEWVGQLIIFTVLAQAAHTCFAQSHPMTGYVPMLNGPHRP